MGYQRQKLEKYSYSKSYSQFMGRHTRGIEGLVPEWQLEYKASPEKPRHRKAAKKAATRRMRSLLKKYPTLANPGIKWEGWYS